MKNTMSKYDYFYKLTDALYVVSVDTKMGDHLHKISKNLEQFYVNTFCTHLGRIEQKIRHVNKIAYDAASRLENKKRKLRTENDPNIVFRKAKQVKSIQSLTNCEMNGTRPFSELDESLSIWDTEISLVQSQHDEALQELEKKKESLKKRLSSIGKLDLLINVLTYKIFETQHEHRKEMEELFRQREELTNKGDLSEDDAALELAELDKRISDIKNTHEATILSLEGQRAELRKESTLKTEHMDIIMESIRVQHDTILADLETKKIDASPSDITEFDRRIAELNRIFLNDVEYLKRLQDEGWRDYDSQEKTSAILESRGVRITPSGHFLTASGAHLTRSEASCLGYLEGIDFASWEGLQRPDLDKTGDSESAITQFSSTASTESRMTSDDIHYLKTVLGKPLTLALAEITAKQPRDPIHYLGHWLFKYRYNQETDDSRKQDIQELVNERDRLERAKLHVMLEDEARTAVLNLVIRAEEEAIRNELERIAREAAMLEAEDEELEAEARDVLGVYGGPTAKNRIN